MLIRATSSGSKNLIKPFMFTLFLTIVVLLFSIYMTYGHGYFILLSIAAAIFAYFLLSTYSLYKEYSEFDNEVDFEDARMKNYDESVVHNGPPGYSMPAEQQNFDPYPPQQPEMPYQQPSPMYPMIPQEQMQQPVVQMPMPYQPAPAYSPPYPSENLNNPVPYPPYPTQNNPNSAPYPPQNPPQYNPY